MIAHCQPPEEESDKEKKNGLLTQISYFKAVTIAVRHIYSISIVNQMMPNHHIIQFLDKLMFLFAHIPIISFIAHSYLQLYFIQTKFYQHSLKYFLSF